MEDEKLPTINSLETGEIYRERIYANLDILLKLLQ